MFETKDLMLMAAGKCFFFLLEAIVYVSFMYGLWWLLKVPPGLEWWRLTGTAVLLILFAEFHAKAAGWRG